MQGNWWVEQRCIGTHHMRRAGRLVATRRTARWLHVLGASQQQRGRVSRPGGGVGGVRRAVRPAAVAEVGPQPQPLSAQGRVEAAGGADALERDGPLAVARKEQAPGLVVGVEVILTPPCIFSMENH